MNTERSFLRRAWFLTLVLLALCAKIHGADSPPTLAARESGVPLYAQQDEESARIASLEKGAPLTALAESLGRGTWYLVRTQEGAVGWVRGSDVVVPGEVKEIFNEKASGASTWAARTGGGRIFNGTWSVAASSSPSAASGSWTLSDGSGKTIARGTWSAEKNSTGWNGIWRATAEGRQSEYTGSWSAELPHVRNARFSELFEAAAKEAIRGLWTGGTESGSWSIRAYK